MDKKNKDRRISIVLNGKEKPYKELNQDKQVYQEIFNNEITAAKEEESFDWILAEGKPNVVDLEEHRREKITKNQEDNSRANSNPTNQFYPRKQQPSLIQWVKSLPLGVIGIVVSAIIVGTSFGFLMLSIFTGEDIQPMASGEIEAKESIPVSSTTENYVSIPSLNVQVIQGGAFSDYEKGNEIAQALKAKGYAAALTKNTDPSYMFIGVGLDKNAAAVIGKKYQEVGQEIYLKPYTISTEGISVEENKENFINEGIKLFETFANITVNEFSTEASKLQDDTLKQLTVEVTALNDYIKAFEGNDTQYSFAIAFKEQLQSIEQQLTNYKDAPDTKKLWNIQQQLLDCLLTYDAFVQSL